MTKRKLQSEPLRTCIACRTERPKSELIRITAEKEGDPYLDRTGKKPGRGAYICRKEECLLKARKKKSLSRALKRPVPESLYDELADVIGEEKNGKKP